MIHNLNKLFTLKKEKMILSHRGTISYLVLTMWSTYHQHQQTFVIFKTCPLYTYSKVCGSESM